MKKFFVFVLSVAISIMIWGCEQSPNIEGSQPTTPSYPDSSSTTLPAQDPSYTGVTSDGILTYEICNKTAKITGVLMEEPSVIIPNEIDGYPVTIIGSGAFYQKHKCSSVVLPGTLVSIESGAFYRCSAITEIWIPSSVAYIAADAFFRVDNLYAIHVESGNRNYCDVDGVLFSSDMTELVTFPEGKTIEEYRIPDGVTSISGCSFGYYPGVRRLIIPPDVAMFPTVPLAVILDNITIISCRDSAAEEYALLWGISFEEYN